MHSHRSAARPTKCAELRLAGPCKDEVRAAEGDLVELGARRSQARRSSPSRRGRQYSARSGMMSRHGRGKRGRPRKRRRTMRLTYSATCSRLAEPPTHSLCRGSGRPASRRSTSSRRGKSPSLKPGSAPLMAKHGRGSIAGAFAWRSLRCWRVSAHRALSLSARKILDRLEIELYRHGGKPEENGRLPCTLTTLSSSAFIVTR